MERTKRCSGPCGKLKPLDEFFRRAASKDGLNARCKECTKIYTQSEENKQKKKEYNKDYFKKYYPENRERLLEYQKDYAQENAEKIADYKKSYAEENAEKIAQYQAQYQEQNREHIRELKKEYKKNNKEYFQTIEAKRRSQKQNAEGSFSLNDWLEICERYGFTCLYPGCTSNDITIDHIVPISKGGTNWPSNLQPLCKPHNSSKHNRHETDYRPDAAQFTTQPQRSESWSQDNNVL